MKLMYFHCCSDSMWMGSLDYQMLQYLQFHLVMTIVRWQSLLVRHPFGKTIEFQMRWKTRAKKYERNWKITSGSVEVVFIELVGVIKFKSLTWGWLFPLLPLGWLLPLLPLSLLTLPPCFSLDKTDAMSVFSIARKMLKLERNIQWVICLENWRNNSAHRHWNALNYVK